MKPVFGWTARLMAKRGPSLSMPSSNTGVPIVGSRQHPAPRGGDVTGGFGTPEGGSCSGSCYWGLTQRERPVASAKSHGCTSGGSRPRSLKMAQICSRWALPW